MFEGLSNLEGKLIDSNYEEYIIGIKENKIRRDGAFQMKGKRKILEQADEKGP